MPSVALTFAAGRGGSWHNGLGVWRWWMSSPREWSKCQHQFQWRQKNATAFKSPSNSLFSSLLIQCYCWKELKAPWIPLKEGPHIRKAFSVMASSLCKRISYTCICKRIWFALTRVYISPPPPPPYPLVFCLLLGVSSGGARPITGQVLLQ